MPNIHEDGATSAFVPDDKIYGKTPKVEPTPEKQIGIDTSGSFFEDIINASISNKLDLSSLDSFLNTSRSRDQIYSLLDTMCEDSTISAVLETYAEDATETNESGDIIWADSSDPDIAKYVTYLLNSMRVNKNIYNWVHSLCKYGDVYLRIYRESEYTDPLFDKNAPTDSSSNKRLNEDVHLSDPDLDPNLTKERLNEDVKLKAYAKDDHYVHYLEMVSNPAEMFELTKFGKTYAYIKTEVNTPLTSNKDWYQGSEFLRYSFKKNDISVYQPTEFVHGYLEDNTGRTPEEVKIFFTDNDNDENAQSATYKVRRGQSLLYNTFKIWRELTLLENSVILNRVTKSSLVRVIGVEVGDMPKEMVGPHLQGIKSLMEQKSALDAGKAMNEYTNPGPIENNVYIPTRDGQGALSLQQVGGDYDPKTLTDIEYFRDKLFGALKVPKQYFGFTEDGAGFNGGQSLSIISSRYAKTIKRIQNTMVQTLTDAINLILIDKGLPHYINEFTLNMLPPTTQEDNDRRESLYNKVQLTQDIMNLVSTDIDDRVTKLKVLKNLISGYITDPEVIHLVQQEIDKAEEETSNESTDTATEDQSSDLGADLGLDVFGGTDSGEIDLDSELNLNTEEEEVSPDLGAEESPESIERTALPTPADLGLDFTDSNAPEFQ